MICLYLQYPFANKYYDKYCGCFSKCWIWVFTTKTERAMEKRYKQAMDSKSEIIKCKSV